MSEPNLSIDAVQALNRSFAATEARLAAELAAVTSRAQTAVEGLSAARQRIADLEATSTQITTQVEHLREALLARDEELRRLNEELFEGDAEIARLDRQFEEADRTRAELAASLSHETAAHAATSARVEQLEALLADSERARTEQADWVGSLLQTGEARDTELRQLHERLHESAAALQLAREDAVRWEQQQLTTAEALHQLERTLAEERAAAASWRQESATQLETLRRLKSALADEAKRADAALADRNAMRVRVQEHEGQLRVHEAELALKTSLLADAEARCLAFDRELAALTEARDRLVAEADARGIEARTLGERLLALEARRADAELAAVHLHEQIALTNAEQLRLVELLRDRDGELSRQAAALDGSRVRIAALETQLGSVAALHAELATTRTALDGTHHERDRLEARVHELEQRLRDLGAERRAIAIALLQAHGEAMSMQSSRLWRLLGALTGRRPTVSPLPAAAAGAFAELASETAAEPHQTTSPMALSNPTTTSPQTNHGPETLEGLLARHDQDFVEAAYRALLRRPPDPVGRDHYLARLRGGASKLQLLVEIGDSAEARRAAVSLPGLAQASRRLRWGRLPLVGRLVRAIAGTEGQEETRGRLRAIEQQVARLSQHDTVALDRLQRTVGALAEQLRAGRAPDAPRSAVRTVAPAPVFFTICSKNFTAYARTLHESIVAHHPGAEFFMFLCDGPDPRFDPSSLPFRVVTLSQLDIPDVEGMSERYNITEFNTAIKPFAFQWLFQVRQAPEVVYLDPDIIVTSPLQEVLDGFRGGADCVLTPHIVNPAEGAEVSDDKMLLFGIYNLGFVALRNTPRVLQIVQWWGRRLERDCVIALEKGLFVDQKWADLFPAFVPNTLVLRHAGYNVAYWNVPERKITRREGVWMANDEPLRFAHFSGNKLDDPTVYSRHSWTLNPDNIGELKLLLDIYRDSVYRNGHLEYSKLPYAYNWNGSSGVNLHTPKPVDETPPAPQEEPPAAPVSATAVAPVRTAVAPVATGDGEPAGRMMPRLFVTDWSTPRPDQDAGSVTTFFMLKILAQLGYDVTFVPSDLEPLGRYTEAVRRLGVRCLDREQVGTMAAFLEREGGQFAAAILFRAPIAGLYLADLRRFAPQARLVLETVDVHFLRDERAAEADGSAEAIENARKAKAWELGIIEACDVSIVLSSFEQELLEKELPGADIRTMPLLFLDMPGPSGRGFAERRDMLFIGGFRHLPNVDAMQWFCREVWPEVRRRLPEARFKIVGSHPPQEILDLAEVDGVDVLGHVQDLDPVFDTIRLSVTPLRFGAGIKGKVATSLGYGVPVVGTALTFEGMELRHERHVLVADEADALVDEIVRGYTDEALWNRLSRDGYERVVALYSESAGRQRVKALMDSLDLKAGDFEFQTFRSQRAYDTWHQDHPGERARRAQVELDLIERGVDSFFVRGWCAVCRCATDFQASFMYSVQQTDDGLPIPNWREHLNCMSCGHVTRVRLMVHLLEHVVRPAEGARIYISEQTTPLFRHLKSRHPQVVGSEFLGDRVPAGQELDGLRNEDLTRLTFADDSFDLMLSCDVLEHVTSDEDAFAECFRCLAPGGTLVFTAPCSLASAHNVIRARIGADGEVEHLITPPEYHGNPVDPENGALCFRYFGWEVLDQLRRAGFADAYVLSTWSRSFGYLGGEQIVFVAHKAA